MAKAEESADKQLQLMKTAVEVHPVTSAENRTRNQRGQSNATGGSKQTQNGSPHVREQLPAKNATRDYCPKVGYLAKACLLKLKMNKKCA